MEIVEDRYQAGSTIITSQLPVNAWNAVIDEPAFADAILDRLIHNAHRLPLDGPSLRKTRDAAPQRIMDERQVHHQATHSFQNADLGQLDKRGAD